MMEHEPQWGSVLESQPSLWPPGPLLWLGEAEPPLPKTPLAMVGCRGLPEPDAHSRWVLSCAVARLGWRKHSFGKRHRGADGALRTPGPAG